MSDRRLKLDIRRDRILQELEQQERISVTSLSRLLGATEVTIRNDLTQLEQEGKLMRVHGGVVRVPRQGGTLPVQTIPALSAKERIARVVAQQVCSGDTLFINSGTTSLCVAQALKEKQNLNIVTNSLAVATELGDVSTFRVLLLGGEINACYGFTYGGDAQEQLRRYQAHWAVLSVDGVSAGGGITTYHAEEAILDRMMIQGAFRTLITADSSKIGKAGFNRVLDCGPELTLVTDAAQSQALDALQQIGMQILVSDS